MKIGILGGTFNPIHTGHLILAQEAQEKLGLDKVIFIPASFPPHKDDGRIADAKKRYAMIKLAISGNSFFSLSDIEIKRGGRSYTIDTIRQLKQRYASSKLLFIIGSDLLNYLAEWKDLREIISMVRFIVATRPGYPLEKIPAYMKRLPIRAVDISAYEIRKRIAADKSFRYLVPEAVRGYILRNKLYK